MQISRFIRIVLPCLLAIYLAGCATVPLDIPKQYSEAIPDTSATTLGSIAEKWVGEHDGQSGFYPLVKGLDALGVRLAMIDLAEVSIDAQYFLMKPDETGRLFADKLLEAADRGVRVRLLLDDIFTTVHDDIFLVVNQHPNIQIRLFNPVSRKGLYALNYLANFKLANRRMHNKSFTVDNAFTVVGGRNIADEYFEILDDKEFRDFDMLAMGPVAPRVSSIFDRFWNHELAVPMEAFDTGGDSINLDKARAEVDQRAVEASESIYGRALSSPLMLKIREGQVELFFGPSAVITDDPDKLLNEIAPQHQPLVTTLLNLVDNAQKEVFIATPYFIPGKDGVDYWRRIVAKGVRVTILTNSLASNNHTSVHSAYARYRRDIIEAGVELYETRVDEGKHPTYAGDKTYDSMTLHVKGMAIDQRYTVSGSLNLDPRSIEINTEFGLFVDNAEMTTELVERLSGNLSSTAYRVTLNDKDQLRWTSNINGLEVVENHEPQASWWLRFKAFMLRVLPESQL